MAMPAMLGTDFPKLGPFVTAQVSVSVSVTPIPETELNAQYISVSNWIILLEIYSSLTGNSTNST
jgi:hypothetical protein